MIRFGLRLTFRGVGELVFFAGVGRPATTNGQIEAYLPGFLLIMAGW